MPPFSLEQSARIRIPANLNLALFLWLRRRNARLMNTFQRSICFLRDFGHGTSSIPAERNEFLRSSGKAFRANAMHQRLVEGPSILQSPVLQRIPQKLPAVETCLSECDL